tara:strand:+ start:6627 stop:7487 length:861 start_codon:yes stop_codon:yes gene_type:complete
VRSLEHNSFGFIKNNYLRTIGTAVVLGIISLALIYIDYTNKIYATSRANIRDVILSTSSVIATPIILLENGLLTARKINGLYKDLQEYDDEQALISSTFQELSTLRLKVDKYESDLKIIKENKFESISVEIFADISNRYFSSILLKAGSNHGLKENNIIVSSNGLIGRVSEVSQDISRGILLTDLSSRVPVSISDKDIQGILIGQNLKKLRIFYIRELSKININDLVMTSGKGGVFPSGLLIGKVSKINNKDSFVEIDIFEDPGNLSKVRIIKYELVNKADEDAFK